MSATTRRSRSRFDSLSDVSRVKVREQAQTIAEMGGWSGGAAQRGAKNDPGLQSGGKAQKATHAPGNTAGSHNRTRSLIQPAPRQLTDIKAGLTAKRTSASREGGESPVVNTGGGKDALARVAAKRTKLTSAKGTGRKVFGGHGR